MPNRNRQSGRDESNVVPIDGASAMQHSPKRLNKQEFGQHLYRLIIKRGWTQSEFARKADLPKDSISTYIRGKTFPSNHSILKMATALDMDPAELAGGSIFPEGGNPLTGQKSDLEIRAHPTQKGWGYLTVDRLVTMKTALRIMDILEEEHAAHAGGSGGSAALLTNDNQKTSD